MYNRDVKDKFCILPWISLSIGTDGQVHPCCQVLPFDEPDNLGDYETSNPQVTSNMERLRSEFLQGKCPKECSQCFNQESHGGTSMRMSKNKEWKTLIESTSFSQRPLDLYEFDVRFSNACQLSCLTCEPLFSTSWYQHDPESLISKSKKALRSFDTVEQIESFLKNHGNHFKLLTITGGEPLLEPMALSFLERVADKGIEINLNTGLMLPESTLKKNLLKLREFHSKKIAISLDAIGEDAEKIRRGLDWNTFLSNLSLLKEELGEDCLYFQITCSSLNAGMLSDIFSWIQKNHPLMLKRTTMNFVHSPAVFNSKNATSEQKKSWIQRNNLILKEQLFEGLSDEDYQKVIQLLSLAHSFMTHSQ